MIYLDNAATTRVRDEVIDVMNMYFRENYGNPSSLYDFGYRCARDINSARDEIAGRINAKSEEIFFNSCATEGNNTAILGSISSAKGKNVITSNIEHSSVFNVYKSIKEKKDVRYTPVDEYGFLNLEILEQLIDENTEIVSIAHVNSELGSIQDIEKMGNIIKLKNKKCSFHVDCAQSYGKLKIDVKKAKIDILTLSGHKLHAPKGIGAIYVNKNINLHPLLLGGGQEKNFRSGTENVPSIMGLKKASEIMCENLEVRTEKLKALRNILISEIKKIEGSKILSFENGISNILAVAFSNIKSEVLLHFLESEKIYISTGSACNKGEKSKILKEIKLSDEFSDGMIRISLCEFNTEEEILIFIEKLKKYIDEIRMIMKRR